MFIAEHECFHSIPLSVSPQVTLTTEVVAGVWSAFHLHKWLLFFISKLFMVVARVILSYSYSSAPALLLVFGAFLVFNGLSRLQDQDDVDGIDEAEVTLKTMRPFVEEEEEDKAEEESEEKNIVSALLDELLANVNEMSLKG